MLTSAKNSIGDLHVSERNWFAVRTGFRKEKVVRTALTKRGVEVYLPLMSRKHEYASKTVIREIPLLSGYLFVHVRMDEVIKVISHDFVHDFVKIGPLYKKVSEREMAHLRYLCGEQRPPVEELDETTVPTTGTLMEIRRGPLAGLRGRLVEYKDREVFLIAFGEMDTRLALMEINAKDVFPIRELAEA